MRKPLTPDGIEKRQVHDLPPISLIVTEHQAERKLCACGHATKADFPEGVNAPVQYGAEVKAKAAYLKNFMTSIPSAAPKPLMPSASCPHSLDGRSTTFGRPTSATPAITDSATRTISSCE